MPMMDDSNKVPFSDNILNGNACIDTLHTAIGRCIDGANDTKDVLMKTISRSTGHSEICIAITKLQEANMWVAQAMKLRLEAQYQAESDAFDRVVQIAKRDK